MTNVLIIWDQINYIYLTFFQAVETGDKSKLKQTKLWKQFTKSWVVSRCLWLVAYFSVTNRNHVLSSPMPVRFEVFLELVFNSKIDKVNFVYKLILITKRCVIFLNSLNTIDPPPQPPPHHPPLNHHPTLDTGSWSGNHRQLQKR